MTPNAFSRFASILSLRSLAFATNLSRASSGVSSTADIGKRKRRGRGNSVVKDVRMKGDTKPHDLNMMYVSRAAWHYSHLGKFKAPGSQNTRCLPCSLGLDWNTQEPLKIRHSSFILLLYSSSSTHYSHFRSFLCTRMFHALSHSTRPTLIVGSPSHKMPTCNGVSAAVFVDGGPLDEYQTQVDANRQEASCWIGSQLGKVSVCLLSLPSPPTTTIKGIQHCCSLRFSQ
jgi:hypothetical protein